MSQCWYAPCSIFYQKRDPAVSNSPLCCMPYVHKVLYVSNRIPTLTMYLILWRIRPCDNMGVAHKQNVTVTQRTLHTKSSLLWHIRIVTQRAWRTIGLWHIGPCGARWYRECYTKGGPPVQAAMPIQVSHNTAHLFLELSRKVADQSVVKIFSSQECVPIGWLHLEYTLLNLQYGNIKGSSSQIKHSYPENTKRRFKTGKFDHPLPQFLHDTKNGSQLSSSNISRTKTTDDCNRKISKQLWCLHC